MLTGLAKPIAISSTVMYWAAAMRETNPDRTVTNSAKRRQAKTAAVTAQMPVPFVP